MRLSRLAVSGVLAGSLVTLPEPALAAVKKRAAAAPAPTAATFDLEDLRIPHRKFVLKNGLTVLVHTDSSVPIVAVNVWYHVGSRNERRGRTGFAHLFEHFFFNGSEHHPSGFREAMDDLGATNRNGTTSTDRTNFFEDVPLSGLEKTLFLEADRMGFLAANLSQEMLERERGVVQNEKRQGENQPYGRVFSRVVESMFPYHHPYSWSTIGSMEDLNAASLADIKEWYQTYYGPNNCVLSLAGAIEPEQALALATKYFGDIPPGPPLPRMSAWVPRLETSLRDTMEDRVPQARVYRVYHAPAWADDELQRLKLAAGILAGSKSSRLERRLVYEKDLATDVGVFVWDKEIASNVIVFATVKQGGDPAAVEKEMDAVLGEYLRQGPTPAEIERSRTRILAELIRGIERLGGFGGRSDVLAESMLFGGDPHAYIHQVQVMLDATPGAVAATSRRWLGDGVHHYTLRVLPMPDVTKAATAVDRSTVPVLGSSPEDIGFPAIQRATLSNGLRVMLLERHSAPLVNLALAVDAGFAADPTPQAGLASLTLGLMDDGTASRDAFQIADQLDALGAEISTASLLDLSLVRLRALRATLAPALGIFADVVRSPSFPADLFELEKKRRLARIAQERAQPVNAALRLAPALLYGLEHAYGKPGTGSGSEETVARITRADLVAWHREWFHPGSATLIVTGDTTLAELVPQLEQALGAWPAGTAPPKSVNDPARSEARGKIYLVDKPDAPQSVIVAGHRTWPAGQAEDLAMEVVMRNFGGMATSRLNRNLRLDKHWSYGTTGFLQDARGERPLLVIAPVQTDKTEESMVEVARELRAIAGERPIAGEEFDNILRGTVSRLPGRFETLDALEDAALDVVNFGLPESYFADYAGNVSRLTEKDLAAAAARFIRPGEVFWIVIGDRRKIEAGVGELGYGEIVHLDPTGKPLPAAN